LSVFGDFGNVIGPLGEGPVEGNPVSKTLTSPGKDRTSPPPGKLTVSVRVAVAVLGQGPVVPLVALMVTLKTPAPVGVPEISPGVQPSELSWQTVRPCGKSVASKLVGLLSAVI